MTVSHCENLFFPSTAHDCCNHCVSPGHQQGYQILHGPTWNPHSESIPELKKFLHGASVPAALFAVQGCLGQTLACLELAPSHRRNPTKGSLDGESQDQAEVQWLVTWWALGLPLPLSGHPDHS